MNRGYYITTIEMYASVANVMVEPQQHCRSGQLLGGLAWRLISVFAEHTPVSITMMLLDILHRGTVLTLAGVTCWGVYAGISVHYHILEAGRRKRRHLLA